MVGACCTRGMAFPAPDVNEVAADSNIFSEVDNILEEGRWQRQEGVILLATINIIRPTHMYVVPVLNA